ncbi:hypothetical protein IFR04_013504 [Cadophora malorum]|uniref:Uncharacterized protein n=1 Tax=Cadophora malorum TaxID=108018 RepID=A0A8H7W5S2_9HELO|nr:hypothetical protein IFR04_013504 [Cadophora malorum]
MESYTNFGSYSFNQPELYDHTAIPSTMTPTPDTSTWWKCCSSDCGREVNPEAHQSTCPDCGHTRCDTCTTTSPPLTPIKNQFEINLEVSSHGQPRFQAAASGYREYTYQQHDNDDYFDTYRSQPMHSLPVSDLQGPESSHTPYPPMTTYWECCQCYEQVNSDFYGDECTGCNHVKCIYCSPVQ